MLNFLLPVAYKFATIAKRINHSPITKKIAMSKVVLIGNGMVGSSYAFALVAHCVAKTLVIIDQDRDKTQGDVLDLSHSAVFTDAPIQVLQGDYSDCQNADLVVICAGVPQESDNKDRLALLSKNTKLFQTIIKNVMASGFDGIIVVATNPVDVLSYATYALSGLPKERVIGSGAILDSARLRHLVGQELNISPQSVNAYVFGEHGDSQTVPWSLATLAGKPISELLTAKEADLPQSLAKTTKNLAYDIVKLKGSTHYGVAMGLVRITKAILMDEQVVLPVSVLLDGEYGHKGVYIGVPAVVGRTGATSVIEAPLTQKEQTSFDQSVKILLKNQYTVDDLIKDAQN